MEAAPSGAQQPAAGDALQRIDRDKYLLGKVDRNDLDAWIRRTLAGGMTANPSVSGTRYGLRPPRARFCGPVVVPYKDIVRAEIQSVLFSSRLVIETKSGTTFRLSVKDPQYVLKLLRRT
jgi:hypothetical protein